MEIEFIKENGIHNIVKSGSLYAYIRICEYTNGYTIKSYVYHGSNSDKEGERVCFSGIGITDGAIKSVASWTSKAHATKRFNEQVGNNYES